MLAHAAQDLRAGQRRSDRISVRPGVRCEEKPITSSDLIQNFVQHPGYPEPRASVFLFLILVNNSSIRPPFCVGAVKHENKFRRMPQSQIRRPTRAGYSPIEAVKAFQALGHFFVVSRRLQRTPARSCRPATSALRSPLTSPMRGSPSSPSTRVAISSRSASPRALAMMFLSPVFHLYLYSGNRRTLEHTPIWQRKR